MLKTDSFKLVRETFESPFEKTRFIKFVKNLLNEYEIAEFTRTGNLIPDSFQNYISKYERLGKYLDGEKHRIDILVVTLKKETSIERARSMQRNFIAGYLQGHYGTDSDKDAALVAFISPDEKDWRFSLVKLDIRLETTPKGGMKPVDEFTPARRWSFLVGIHEKSHTAQSRLVPIISDDEHNPTLEELEEAFNIEKVTKEFFEKYRDLFIRAKSELDKAVAASLKTKADFESKGIDTVNLAKKLLGQIIFLYYLQKKGWFGVPRDGEWGEGSKNFLRNLFAKKKGDENFFNDILEHLFYDALRNDRSYDDHYYGRFNCKIPFLNGGLFDPMNNYDWVHTDILLPDSLFSNRNKTKEGDTGDGILDIFDRYNFTVKEDEPFEKEVAIDPELLGKAYEKFNAIRPDNYEEYLKALESGKKGEESKFNKQYGVYYTPREIVHYMCQQSLINYLATELEDKVNKEELATLIHQGENLREHEARAALKETKTYSPKLPESIRQNARRIDEKLATIKVCDPAVGSGAFPVGMMSEIVRARNVLSVFIPQNLQNLGRTRGAYNLKHECIENSLYGVDIDAGAVEIAKLRLWLSLIVDEEDIQSIKPLPNLDYKIVQGNSLLGVEKNLFNHQLFAELEALKPRYFNTTNPTEKQEYKKQIDSLIEQITDSHIQFDYEIYFSEVFHKKGGFDIVIANPPYISHYSKQSQKIEKGLEENLRKNYDFLGGKGKKIRINSMMFFIEKGYKILCLKGTLAYIMDLNILENPFVPIREYVTARMNILEIIKGLTVFEGIGSGQVIAIARRGRSNNKIRIKSSLYELDQTIDQDDVVKNGYSWDFSNNLSLIKKIETKTIRMSKLLTVHTGVAVYATEEGKLTFIKDSKENNCYPLLLGSTSVGSSYCNPVFKKHVLYDKKLESKMNDGFDKKYFAKNGSHQRPFNLRKIDEYNRPKIILRQSDTKFTATYSDDLMFGNYSLFNIYSVDNNVETLKFVLGLINSKLLTYYGREKNIILIKPGKTPQIRSGQKGPIGIQQIPIKDAPMGFKRQLVSIVDRVLVAKRANPQADTSALEREIDQLVYQLYGLTEEEIKIVEGG